MIPAREAAAAATWPARQPGPDWRLRAGALSWLLCVQFFVAEQVTRIHVLGPYSMTDNAISDLGAVHAFGYGAAKAGSYSPLHVLMNVSFALQGLLIFFGAGLLQPRLARGALSRSAFLLFQLSAAGLFVVGLAPEDVSRNIHLPAAALHFVCGGVAMLTLGVALLSRVQKAKVAGTLSIAAGVIALCATLVLGLPDQTWRSLGWMNWTTLPMGAIERVAAYPLPIWLTTTGLVLLMREKRLGIT